MMKFLSKTEKKFSRGRMLNKCIDVNESRIQCIEEASLDKDTELWKVDGIVQRIWGTV